MTASKLIAANWKMNLLAGDATEFAAHAAEWKTAHTDMTICAPATLLAHLSGCLNGAQVSTGGQDCHEQPKGAFTGDISAEMLANVGAGYVIVGHSERRAGHAETSEQVSRKAAAAMRAGLIPIICVGESLDVREAGHAEAKVCAELELSLPEGGDSDKIVVAYEPIWAIGTGKTCDRPDIERMHAALRETLIRYDGSLAGVRILYGGSVKGSNAEAILGTAHVDGALVGGASLDAVELWSIIAAAEKIAVGHTG